MGADGARRAGDRGARTDGGQELRGGGAGRPGGRGGRAGRARRGELPNLLSSVSQPFPEATSS